MTLPWNAERASKDLVRVRRLRVLAPADQAPALRAELERVPWPAAPDRSWVLIRGLRIAAPRSVFSLRTREQVGDLVRAAVSIDAPGADSADAVRCEDLPALLAALTTDLASGQARSRWYWRAWSALFGLPAGLAVATLLGEQPQSLAATTEQLARRGGLAPVWNSLSDSDVSLLADRLAGWLERPLPLPGERPVDPSAALADAIQLPDSLVRRWSPALSGLAWNHPRRWLAACLCTLEWRPLWLGPEAGEAVAWVSAALGDNGADRVLDRPETSAQGSSAAHAEHGAAGHSSDLESAVAGQPSDRLSAPAAEPPRAASAGRVHAASPGLVRDLTAGSPSERWGKPSASAPDSEPDSGPDSGLAAHSAAGAALEGDGQRRTGSNSARASAADLGRVRVSIRSGLPDAGPGEPAVGKTIGAADEGQDSGLAPRRTAAGALDREPADRFEATAIASEFGGLFYLINFLSRPEAQVRLDVRAGFRDQGDGWAWLRDLGLRLGMESEPGLDAFFAERLGLDGPGALRQLPWLPLGAELLDLGERLYGPDTFNAALLRVPARLRHTASHLDLDLPLASVRLEVRQVGLDVDPGWVPWLGRVVRFHYLERWGTSAGGPSG